MVPLSADGLSVTAAIKKVYDGWKYPDDWVVEGFAQEGPKMLKRGEYYYMVLAEGGTAGPPTSHMVIAARSKTIEGPWENSPYNAIIRTKSADERWWSKGHATLVEGPSSRSTTAPTARPGSASTRGWRCRGITTTWRTIS